MLKDFPSNIYLITTLGGGIAIVEGDELSGPPDGVRYVKADTVTNLLSKAYNSGLENRRGFTDITGDIVTE